MTGKFEHDVAECPICQTGNTASCCYYHDAFVNRPGRKSTVLAKILSKLLARFERPKRNPVLVYAANRKQAEEVEQCYMRVNRAGGRGIMIDPLSPAGRFLVRAAEADQQRAQESERARAEAENRQPAEWASREPTKRLMVLGNRLRYTRIILEVDHRARFTSNRRGIVWWHDQRYEFAIAISERDLRGAKFDEIMDMYAPLSLLRLARLRLSTNQQVEDRP